jgi:hypothetical protein
MTIILIPILVYVLSFIALYKYFQVEFGPKGNSSDMSPECAYIAVCFVPIINTILAVGSWLFFWPYKGDAKKFFRIK